MTKQEVTYTEEVEKTEEMLVCDSCGVEVEEGEDCKTLVEWDSLRTGPYDRVEFFKDEGTVDSNGTYTVNPDTVRDRFAKEAHICLSCWSDVNLSLDEETAHVIEDFESVMKHKAKKELREEWRNKSIATRMKESHLKTWFFLVAFFGLTVGVFRLGMGLFTLLPLGCFLLVFMTMITDAQS